MAPSRGLKWQSALGQAYIRSIMAHKIPEWPAGLHDWQLITIARILDGEDTLCITATGDGKSAVYNVAIIVLREVAARPEAFPGLGAVKKSPVGIVVALLYYTDIQRVEVADPLFGVVPRRLIGVLGISLATATVMMAMWGRLDGVGSWEALCRISVIWTGMAIGASLGDILPG